jgi:hypothetical protein
MFVTADSGSIRKADNNSAGLVDYNFHYGRRNFLVGLVQECIRRMFLFPAVTVASGRPSHPNYRRAISRWTHKISIITKNVSPSCRLEARTQTKNRFSLSMSLYCSIDDDESRTLARKIKKTRKKKKRRGTKTILEHDELISSEK